VKWAALLTERQAARALGLRPVGAGYLASLRRLETVRIDGRDYYLRVQVEQLAALRRERGFYARSAMQFVATVFGPY